MTTRQLKYIIVLVVNMIKICKICENEFITDNYSRIYCYNCSGNSSKNDIESRKHQKTILRRSMKLQAIKLLGGKCIIDV